MIIGLYQVNNNSPFPAQNSVAGQENNVVVCTF